MKSQSILIVDEAEAVRESLKLVLMEEGFHCRVAPDTDTAIEKLSTETVGVIVLDSHLLGTGEFLQLLKEKYPRTGIIIMSSYVEIAVTQKALIWGAHDFVVKPLDFKELIDKVKDYFSSFARE